MGIGGLIIHQESRPSLVDEINDPSLGFVTPSFSSVASATQRHRRIQPVVPALVREEIQISPGRIHPWSAAEYQPVKS